jgi:hypothetical protein
MARDFQSFTPNQLGITRLKRSSAKIATGLKTEQVAMRARLLAPGGMKDNIRVIFKGGPAPLGIVICDHEAASFVLHGTKAHVIKPRNRKVLKFEINGRTVFAKQVNHPGTEANNFLLKALIATRKL